MFESLPLRDIHLPEPVSWWPPAPGWWLLPIVAVLVSVVVFLAVRQTRGYGVRRRLRAHAFSELETIERRYTETGDRRTALQDVSALLRRVAITVFPQRRVAGIAGRDWVEWIVETGPAGLEPDRVSPLADAPYRPDPGVGAPAVLGAARLWIRHVTRNAGHAS